MPRPTRVLYWVAPSLFFSSFSFIFLSCLWLYSFFNFNQMLNRLDHAAHRRGIFQRFFAVALAEAKAVQRLFLIFPAADWAADLCHFYFFLCICHNYTPLASLTAKFWAPLFCTKVSTCASFSDGTKNLACW